MTAVVIAVSATLAGCSEPPGSPCATLQCLVDQCLVEESNALQCLAEECERLLKEDLSTSIIPTQKGRDNFAEMMVFAIQIATADPRQELIDCILAE